MQMTLKPSVWRKLLSIVLLQNIIKLRAAKSLHKLSKFRGMRVIQYLLKLVFAVCFHDKTPNDLHSMHTLKSGEHADLNN